MPPPQKLCYNVFGNRLANVCWGNEMQEESPQDQVFVHQKRTWLRKFGDAFRGVWQSIRQQSSYRVHFFFALVVPIAGALVRLYLLEWCFVLLLIAVVIAAEMFNTSIENLARAITDKSDERIGYALDIASGAVLVISICAAILGTILFTVALLRLAS